MGTTQPIAGDGEGRQAPGGPPCRTWRPKPQISLPEVPRGGELNTSGRTYRYLSALRRSSLYGGVCPFYAGTEELVDAFAEWLSRWEWDYWVTLTHRFPQSEFTSRKVVESWLRAMSEGTRTLNSWPISAALFQERHKSGLPHWHGLLRLPKHLVSATGAWGSWFGLKNGGRAKVESYDSGRGASFYLAKYCLKDLGESIIQVSHPQKGADGGLTGLV